MYTLLEERYSDLSWHASCSSVHYRNITPVKVMIAPAKHFVRNASPHALIPCVIARGFVNCGCRRGCERDLAINQLTVYKSDCSIVFEKIPYRAAACRLTSVGLLIHRLCST